MNVDDSINKLNNTSSITNNIKCYVDSFSFSENTSNKENIFFKEISSYSDINSHFFCKKCKTVPQLKFINFNKVNYSCGCYISNNMSIDNIFNNNIIKDYGDDEGNYKEGEINNYNIANYLKCSEHNKHFLYYCETGKQNLCRDCLKLTDYHHNHILLLFDLKYFEMKKMKEHIDKILINEKKNVELDDILDNEKDNQINRLMTLLSIIFNDFVYYPNKSHIDIISDAQDFIDKFIYNKNNSDVVSNLQLEKQRKIYSRKLLLENITNSENIIEFNIYKSNLKDLTDLCKLNLINLKRLILAENCIVNIEPIQYANFKNLELLNFALNKLGNENIKYLFNLKFPKLIELNLYSNSITDYKIFKLKNNQKCLPSLETLYIGMNIINWNINNDIDNKVNIQFELSSLKAIGLTGGIFDNRTISFIECFKFHNLENLYLSRNTFNSISFMHKFDLPLLKYFSVHTSNVKDFYPLIKFKNLEYISFRFNCISNIDKLKIFVENLPKLNTLDLGENLIDINDKENQEIINYFNNKKEPKLKNFYLIIN